MIDTGRLTGLPDIPGILPYIPGQFTYPIGTMLEWVPIAPADPTRYYLNIMPLGGGTLQVTTNPDDAFDFGWQIRSGEDKEFKLLDQLGLVTQAWYACSKSFPWSAQVYEAFVRFKG